VQYIHIFGSSLIQYIFGLVYEYAKNIYDTFSYQKRKSNETKRMEKTASFRFSKRNRVRLEPLTYLSNRLQSVLQYTKKCNALYVPYICYIVLTCVRADFDEKIEQHRSLAVLYMRYRVRTYKVYYCKETCKTCSMIS
jgi:hypothetical protein